MNHSLPFRYRLAALLKHEENGIAGLREQVAQAVHRLDGAQREEARLRESGEAGRKASAALLADSAMYWASLCFLRELEEQRVAADRRLDDARSAYEDACARLKAAQARVRQLERHRDRQREVHRVESKRRDYLALDEAWARRAVRNPL
ncbi:hypothetical protein [Paludibacterium paludis]|uniref:Flagellar FliJ protein n=1 Tax=Paludibacterium paludis TaxID=1225769 RepID=A0A918P6Y5_9NEIS|nr:hypothetical protein [Paludibacterium paludis]GGY28866.1 hypothetical protein GCM10011289_35050 [Paludibacterium paludis]